MEQDLKVGDLVVAENAANSIQQVIEVVPNNYNPDYPFLKLITVWRLTGGVPNPKTTRKQGGSYGYRRVTADELWLARERLSVFITELLNKV